ncbi:hypothetical protein AQUCO_05500033v1 [Aquilegia coerulea]|uniref:Cysteine-rich receptor-like protein kinase 10 n=1 Tax=Aquilegia coerulea TaxID=218851 RepID=A0A2G5CGW6_AQUCA|nr:hypothetical protein AQUCO_05500033v1 [Aquilegia coerulea]
MCRSTGCVIAIKTKPSFSSFLLRVRIHAQNPWFPPSCDTAFNYTPNSLYHTNLNLTLQSLTANTFLNGFNTTTLGENPDQVYGLLQCRGDISPRDCQTCADISSLEILQRCKYQKEALVYYNNCFLRYAHYRFFSTATSNPELWLSNSKAVSDPRLFSHKLGVLMNNLSSTAASNSSRFSTGMTDFMDFLNIYGLVQCTRDLSEISCLSCLQRMISYIPTCCNGSQGSQVYAKSCFIRYEIYSFFQSSPLMVPSPPLVASLPPDRNSTFGTPTEGATNRKGKLPFSFSAIICENICKRVFKLYLFLLGDREQEDVGTVESLIFDLSTLKAATGDFSDSHKLGQGGFGPVYKGELSDGRQVAVKRLSHTSGQGLEELKTEVVLVAKLLHRNLVSLVGFCLEREEKLLVYELLPNGSLDQTLFDESKSLLLDWDIRYRIIVGIAKGLLYLHHDSQIRIIHRDLKASNILLDEDMNPKISDFGLARLFRGSQTQANTNRIAGTYGYMAPEYAKNGHFSTKSDVFSFGVLILEIVTGRKNSDFQDTGNLQSFVWHHWTDGTTIEIMDKTLGDQWLESEALKCIHIGLLCLQQDASNRPTMTEVMLMLSSYTFTCPVPSQPAFYVKTSNAGTDVINGSTNNGSEVDRSSMKSSEQSVNEVTISELEPR